MRKRIHFLVLCTFIFFLYKQGCFAQPIGFDPFVPIRDLIMNQWTNENGLKSNNLTSIYQSTDGYIWITSHNGIYRFDGVSFKIFDKDNISLLVSSSIGSMHEDEEGIMWFATQSSGVLGYDSGDFFNLPKNDSLPKSTTVVRVDSKGVKWIGTRNIGLIAITSDSIIIRPDFIPEVSINGLEVDSEDRIYASTNGDGLHIIEGRRTTHLTTKDGLLSDIVNCTFSQYDKTYIGTINGINEWDGRQLIAIDEFSGLEINQILIDGFGTLWAATEEGLARYNEIADVFELFSLEHGLPGRQISGISFDDEGSLWLSTNKAGLVRFKEGKIRNITEINGLSSSHVNVISKHNNEYFIGTDDGSISVLSDGQSKKIDFGIQFHNVGIRDFLFHSNGDFWAVSYEGAVRVKNGETKFYNTENGLPTNEIRRIFEDSRGNVWLGTRVAGLIKLNLENEKNHNTYDRTNGLESDYVLSIEEDNFKNIIIGTNSGGMSIMNQAGDLKTFHIYEDDAGILIFNTFIDKDNAIWLCTNIGFFVFRNESFRKIEIESDLISESFFDVVDDHAGHYWLTTNLGVVSISRKELNMFLDDRIHEVGYELFNKSDGMANNECTGAARAFYDASERKIWIPTFEGVAIVDPIRDIESKRIPQMYITDFIVDNENFDQNDNGLKIDFEAFRYTFNFTSLSFLRPEKVKFMYMLKGFDLDWMGPVTERSVQYTNLAPGKYQFLVKGSNSSGNLNENRASFSFEIIPAFYKTGWFYIIVILAIMFTLYSIYNWRMYDITKRNDALKKINDELDRFVYSASHDLRAPLASIMGLVNIIRNEKNESERQHYFGLIDQCANKMDVFINDIIDYSRNKNKSILVESINVSTLVNEAFDTLKYLNFENKVELEFKVLGEKFINSDARRLNIILSNLVANAINYSDTKKAKCFVRVNVKVERDLVQFKVTDNGIGIPEKESEKIFMMFYRAHERSKGSGLGLYIVKETLEKLGGTIAVESKVGKWTSFRFNIPNEELRT